MTATPYAIDAATARHIILHLQSLTRQSNRRLSRNELYDLIETLGFVQLDSIQWVERAHHMILFARNQTYRPIHLAPLVEEDQRLFENWTHDASFIPSRFFSYWRHKFRREETALIKKFTNWQGNGFAKLTDELIRKIESDGPLMSRDLDRPAGKQEMWQWHDGKAALEILWRTGRLAIKARRNFQKVYDLPSRCLSAGDLTQNVTHDDFINWACNSALTRLGFGSPADIARFWDLLTIDEVKQWLTTPKGLEQTRPVCVTGADKSVKTLFARADIEDVICNLPPMSDKVRILSPFDPVIRDRKRLMWLWDFDYRIEIYVPEAKRIWGYYIFPLLEKDRIIGRIDMKSDRKSDTLIVRNLWLENKFKPSQARYDRIDAELKRQARFSGVSKIKRNGIL